MKYLIAIFLIIAVPLFFLFQNNGNQDNIKGSSMDIQLSLSGLQVFTTPTCPHCRVVKDYLNEKNISLEIGELTSQDNQNQFKDIVENKCSPALDINEVGVPFLFDEENSTCLMGDQPIIDYINGMLPQQ
ncbi:MAG: glutathione S-transferase N-terminal domain-containing protein [Patescibacteria group bacterium]|jgi:glutaredoxin